MLMGALGSLLPSPPTSLTHVPSLRSLLCQIALKSAFSPPFLFSLHIFSVGGLRGLVLSSACQKIPLLKSCSEQELAGCSASEAFLVLSAVKLHEHTYGKDSNPGPTMSSSPFQHSCPTAQPCHAPRWFRCERIYPPSIAVSTNTKQHNSRAKTALLPVGSPSSIILL